MGNMCTDLVGIRVKPRKKLIKNIRHTTQSLVMRLEIWQIFLNGASDIFWLKIILQVCPAVL